MTKSRPVIGTRLADGARLTTACCAAAGGAPARHARSVEARTMDDLSISTVWKKTSRTSGPSAHTTPKPLRTGGPRLRSRSIQRSSERRTGLAKDVVADEFHDRFFFKLDYPLVPDLANFAEPQG